MVFHTARAWLSSGLSPFCCQALQPQVLHHFLGSLAHRDAVRTGGGSRARRLWHTLPAAACHKAPAPWHSLGRDMSHAPMESCGVLQAVAVLEDTARGQSACLESASSCYIPTKVPEQHFSCSSLFLFLCAFPQKVCYAHRQPRASEQVG